MSALQWLVKKIYCENTKKPATLNYSLDPNVSLRKFIKVFQDFKIYTAGNLQIFRWITLRIFKNFQDCGFSNCDCNYISKGLLSTTTKNQ